MSKVILGAEASSTAASEFSPQRYSQCIDKDVVIVGAGMAGIGAALTLLKHGCENFVILEAQALAGGRIQSVLIGDNIYVEEGAQWIHGQNNPVYQWADKHRLIFPVRSDEAQGVYLRDDGSEVPQDLVHQVAGAVGNILEKCEEFWSCEIKDYPQSLGRYLDEQFEIYLKSQPPDKDDTLRYLYDWHKRFQIIDNSCDSLYDLSAKAWGQYGFCGGEDYINLSQGFSSVVGAMTQQIPIKSIQYLCPVKQILWDNLFLVKDQVVYGEERIEDAVNSFSINSSQPTESLDSIFGVVQESVKKYSPNENSLFAEVDTSGLNSNVKESHSRIINSQVGKSEVCSSIFKSDNINTESQASLNGNSSNKSRTLSSLKETKSLDEVIVKCEDGTSYRAKHVVVTSSLGYLKENQNHMFVPRLPKCWSQAISSMGFGSITKIFLVYSAPWWNPMDRGFQFIWTRSPHCPRFEQWLREITGFDVLVSPVPVLLGWVGGAHAEEVETLSETEIGSACTRLLSHFTQRELPLPCRVVRSSWKSNRYIRGAYSHTTATCDRLGITTHTLSAPVPSKKRNTIYFAGEALHEKYFSTTHGAFLSGSEQATKIAEELNRESRVDCQGQELRCGTVK